MSQLTVTVPTHLEGTLAALATANGITPEEYLGSVVESHLLTQYKADLYTFFVGQGSAVLPALAELRDQIIANPV